LGPYGKQQRQRQCEETRKTPEKDGAARAREEQAEAGEIGRERAYAKASARHAEDKRQKTKDRGQSRYAKKRFKHGSAL
jgi:hypothetical protein